MATVTMPQLGESVTEGTILTWLKQPGEPVKLDDPLCEIETEKVTAELPSPYEGTMGEILVPQGETVKVGSPLCTVAEATAGSEAPAAASRGLTAGGGWGGGPMAIPAEDRELPPLAVNGTGAHAAVAAAPRPAPAATTSAGRPSHPEDRGRFYSPAVMRLAAEHGVDLGGVTGTGIGGRVTRKDVEAAISAGAAAPRRELEPEVAHITSGAAAAERPLPPPPASLAPSPGPGYEVVTLSATRRSIAANLARSNRKAPQAWTMVEADVTGLVRLREREKERFRQQEGIDLTLLPYFTAAVCEALREYPILNARWEGDELRRYHALDIGIAVAAESGLVVPVLHGAGDLSVAGLAKRIADVAQRAHARKLRVEDIEGGTFTVNNTGAFGSIASKPIVNYPQVAIVSMERAVRRPVVREDDSIAVRWMMNVCLSFDHRAMDGLEAGGFLASLKRRLEGYA